MEKWSGTAGFGRHTARMAFDARVELVAKAERELQRAGRTGDDWPEWDAPDPERGELKIDREFWRALARRKIVEAEAFQAGS